MINKHIYALTLLIFSTQFILAQRIVINFDATPNTTPSVSKATLRYDKDFAYSLTFDDATIDGYTCALPALQGGLSACSGTTVTPLYYTDGCGNNLLFKAGIAWNSANFYGQDSHTGNTPGLLTWTQLDELLSKDWDVLNHSFSHKARWIQYMPGTEYINEIVKNRTEVKQKTAKNYDTPIFVVPSGDTYYQDIAYAQGQKLVFDQSANTIGMGGLSVNNNFTPDGRVVHRQLLEDALNSGQDKIGRVASKSAAGDRIWYNEFTHHLDGTTGLSFSNFRNHLERIANTWGKNGTDRIWVAGLQEVYEYLTVRKKIEYTATVNGNQLIIDFDLHDLPDWLRRKPLTLVVNSATSFSSVTATQGITMTYNGTSSKKIINLDFANASTINPCDTDITKPILSACPQNISLTTTGTSAIANWTAPTATDNCTSNPSVKSNFLSGQSFSIGSTTVIYTATDAKNNSSTCSFDIVITKITINPCDTDITKPILSACPQNISLTTTGTSAIANWTAPTATDNCTSTPSVKSNFLSGQSFPIGSTTVIYTATDAKNNSSTCSFDIVITKITINPCDTDITKPILSACPQNISLTTTGTSAIANWTAPTATDNCTSNPSVTSNFLSGQSFPIGSTPVIYTATDAKNNTTTCSFNVVVTKIFINPCDTDIIKPILSACPQNISLTTTGTSAIANWTAPTATDNCTSNPSVKSNFLSGQSFPIGSTTVVYTTTDAKNNSSTCSFDIVITKITINPCDTDITKPILSACPQNISLTTTGTSAIANWTAPTATDNCTSNPSVTSDFESGQKFALGTTTVTYTATDIKGNRAKCSFYVVVTRISVNPCDNDITKPVLSACPNNILLTTEGTSARATWTAPTATDNCTSNPSVKSNFESGQNFPIGSTTVVYTATDAKNNSATCRFNVVVQANSRTNFDLAVSLSTTPNTGIRPYTVAVYRITLKNLSSENCRDIVVNFPFPQGLVNGGVPQASTGLWEEYCANSRLCYEWSINALAANATATLDVPLFVLGLSTPITATAKLLSSLPVDNLSNNNQASVTIGGSTAPSVSAAYKTSPKIPIIINKILPNPSIGDLILMVESIDEREANFNVADAFGKIIRVETQKVVKGTNQLVLDMWSLPQGIYFITPTTSLGRGMPVKFVKL